MVSVAKVAPGLSRLHACTLVQNTERLTNAGTKTLASEASLPGNLDSEFLPCLF